MWCWRRWEKISWTDHVRNEEVLKGLMEDRNILHKIKMKKAKQKDLLKNDTMNIHKESGTTVPCVPNLSLHGGE